MSLSKKGTRKIIVNGVYYRWRVSQYQIVSNWRVDAEVIDGKYLEIAQRFGLGDIADVVFNIVIELYDDPKSKMIVKYFGLVVDGFLGPEQFVQIKPKLVSELIGHGTNNGWVPNLKGDYKLEIFENSGKKHRPAVVVLPNLNDEVVDYENFVKPIKIW